MSIINQMLKDLEQRRAQGFDNNADMLDNLDAGAAVGASSNSSKNIWLVFILFFLLVGLAAWLYLSGYFQKEKKFIVAKPVQIVEHKSIIQDATIKGDQLEGSKLKDEKLKSIEENLEALESKIEPVPDKIVPLEEQQQVVNLNDEIKISAILPSPLRATGSREIITVYGEGFIEPLVVTMEWNGTHSFKDLEGWQVKVISDTELQLHVNLGKKDDDWRLLIKRPGGEQQADYKFSVLAIKQEPAEVKEKPAEIITKPKIETSFTKTNRSLSQDDQVRLAYSKASLLIKQGKINKAKQSLRQVLSLNFAHLKARQTLASILFREQAYDEAIEVLELGSIQHPKHVPFTLLLARIYTERGQDPLAVNLLERLQPAVASNSEYYALLAALYQRSAQYNKAAGVYKKLLASFPSRAVWWMGLGLSLQSLQQNKDALDAYKRSLQTQGLTAELRRFIKTRIEQLSN